MCGPESSNQMARWPGRNPLCSVKNETPQTKFNLMEVSVIIPAYNEEKYLPETLERVAKALTFASYPSEIIVVDNDSQDQTKQIAETFGAKVILEKEHNIAEVRNTGALNASGDVLI